MTRIEKKALLTIAWLFLIPMLINSCQAIDEKEYSLRTKISISYKTFLVFPFAFQSVSWINVNVELTNLGNEPFYGTLTIEGRSESGFYSSQQYLLSNLTKHAVHNYARSVKSNFEGKHQFTIKIEEKNLSRIYVYQDSKLMNEGYRIEERYTIYLHSFSEYIAIIGIVVGAFVTFAMGFLIHYLRIRRESPHLKAEVLKCEHDFQKKVMSFWVDFRIRNHGDRGTTIYRIDLTFKEDGKEYHSESAHSGRSVVEGQTGWVPSHDTIELSKVYFAQRYEGRKKEQINCTFTILHTHGKEKAKSISLKRE